MAQKSKVEEQRRDNAQKGAKNDKKNIKKDNKADNRPMKQVSQPRNSATTNGKVTQSSTTSSAKVQKKQIRKSQNNRGCCSTFMSIVNSLLLLAVVGAAVWCFHIHCEGDYSRAGIEASIPRLHKSLLKLQNSTAEALQPDNLRATGQLVFQHANNSLHLVGSAIQKTAYSAQEYIEVYTGDLTPYTSKVSSAYRSCCDFVCFYCHIVYKWLLAQDWQGFWNTTVHYANIIYTNIKTAITTFWQHPTVQAAWRAICHYASIAFTQIVLYCHFIFQYLCDNVPIWLEMVRDNGNQLFSYIKSNIESMLK